MSIDKLRTAYQVNELVALICDELANRSNNQRETKLLRMLGIVNADREHSVRHGLLIAAFRELEDCECGEYIEGRRGKKSRFKWNPKYGSLNTCKAAQGEAVEEAPANEAADEGVEDDADSEVLDHYFNLRADYQLELTLPVDLSEPEAERLATFIRSLPLEDFQ